MLVMIDRSGREGVPKDLVHRSSSVSGHLFAGHH